MEDSLKGLLVTLTIASLFMTGVLSFITLFPQEQGMTIAQGQDGAAYLVFQNLSQSSTTLSDLGELNNNTNTGFNQWDVTVGFMGSNTVKQASKTGISGYASNLFTNLRIMATTVFGLNSPIIYAIAVFSSLTTGWIIYLIIKFVRTGN